MDDPLDRNPLVDQILYGRNPLSLRPTTYRSLAHPPARRTRNGLALRETEYKLPSDSPEDPLQGPVSVRDLIRPTAKPESSSFLRRTLGDTAISLLGLGPIQAGEAVVGLADIPTSLLGMGPVAGDALESIGYDPKEAKEILSDYYSPEYKAAEEEVAKAKGLLPSVEAYVRNPSTIAQGIASNLPSMIGGAQLVRRGLVAAAPKALEKLAPEGLALLAGSIGEGATQAGQSAEQTRQTTGGLTPTQAGLAISSGVIDAAIAGLSGRVASKLGIADPQVLFAGGGAASDTGKRLVRRVAEGLINEGFLQELPQSAQEQVHQNISEGRPWNEGVAEAAAQGLVLGGAMGAGANLMPTRKAVPRFGEKEALAAISTPPPQEGPQSVRDLLQGIDSPVAPAGPTEPPGPPGSPVAPVASATPAFNPFAAAEARMLDPEAERVNSARAAFGLPPLEPPVVGAEPAPFPAEAQALRAQAPDVAAVPPPFPAPPATPATVQISPDQAQAQENLLAQAYQPLFDKVAAAQSEAQANLERQVLEPKIAEAQKLRAQIEEIISKGGPGYRLTPLPAVTEAMQAKSIKPISDVLAAAGIPMTPSQLGRALTKARASEVPSDLPASVGGEVIPVPGVDQGSLIGQVAEVPAQAFAPAEGVNAVLRPEQGRTAPKTPAGAARAIADVANTPEVAGQRALGTVGEGSEDTRSLGASKIAEDVREGQSGSEPRVLDGSVAGVAVHGERVAPTEEQVKTLPIAKAAAEANVSRVETKLSTDTVPVKRPVSRIERQAVEHDAKTLIALIPKGREARTQTLEAKAIDLGEMLKARGVHPSIVGDDIVNLRGGKPLNDAQRLGKVRANLPEESRKTLRMNGEQNLTKLAEQMVAEGYLDDVHEGRARELIIRALNGEKIYSDSEAEAGILDKSGVVEEVSREVGAPPSKIRAALVKDKGNPLELEVKAALKKMDPFDTQIQAEETKAPEVPKGVPRFHGDLTEYTGVTRESMGTTWHEAQFVEGSNKGKIHWFSQKQVDEFARIAEFRAKKQAETKPIRKPVSTEKTKAGTQVLLPGAEGMMDTTGKVGKLKAGQEDVSKAPLFQQEEEAAKKADAAKQRSIGEEEGPKTEKSEKPRFSRRESSLGRFDPRRIENFRSWFGNSKVVDAEGNPLVVYHGARRPDRIGGTFRKDRATSGPMSFFADDPKVASGYATSKQDTSLEPPSDYAGWFKYTPKGSRSAVDLDRAWYSLPPEMRQKISKNLPHVTYENSDEGTGPFILSENEYGLADKGHWDYEIGQAKGNVLKAAKEVWLSSGSLFNDEEKFMDVLRAAGMDMSAVKYDDPWAEYPGVFPVHLAISKPFDTSKIMPEDIESLQRAANRTRKPVEPYGTDPWDKNTQEPQNWMERLREGKGHAWTSIPDWVTKDLKRRGFDGIKDTGGKNGGPGYTVWIPFESEQIKAAFGNTGAYANKKDIRFSRRAAEAPAFYSALERAAESLKQPMRGADMLRFLTTREGVKKAELFWTGLEEFLQKKSDQKVTPAEVQEFLKANKVTVTEVAKGGAKPTPFDGWTDEDIRDHYRKVIGEEPDENMPVNAMKDEIAAVEDLDYDFTDPGAPKFAQYQTPGAVPGSYREVLLTLPEKKRTIEASSAVNRWNVFENGQKIASDVTRQEAERLYDVTAGKDESKFRSSHFDEPNILAHVRMNDRMVDGKKTLHIEEIQSDRTNKMLDAKRLADKAKKSGDEKAYESHMAEYNRLRDMMPFADDYYELALKQILLKAANEGYDQVTLSTGDIQNERWDLSKQIGAMRVTRTDGKFMIEAYRKENETVPLPVLFKSGLEANELPDVVGKGMADKIVEDFSGDREVQVRSYRGLDLKVGGEGKKTLYDKIIPQALNKLAKKWGSKTGTTQIDDHTYPTPPGPYRLFEPRRRDMVQRFRVEDADGRSAGSFDTLAEAKARIVALENRVLPTLSVHSLTITPEMRASVISEGFPLFNRPDTRTADEVEEDWSWYRSVHDSEGEQNRRSNGERFRNAVRDGLPTLGAPAGIRVVDFEGDVPQTVLKTMQKTAGALAARVIPAVYRISRAAGYPITFGGFTPAGNLEGVVVGGKMYINPIAMHQMALSRAEKEGISYEQAFGKQLAELLIHEGAHFAVVEHGDEHNAEMARLKAELGQVAYDSILRDGEQYARGKAESVALRSMFEEAQPGWREGERLGREAGERERAKRRGSGRDHAGTADVGTRAESREDTQRTEGTGREGVRRGDGVQPESELASGGVGRGSELRDADGRVDQSALIAFARGVENRHGLERFDLLADGDDIVLAVMVTPRANRSQGRGSAAMRDLLAFADENGKRIVVTPARRGDLEGVGPTSYRRTESFYERFGFVNNKGANRDETVQGEMYRKPTAKPSFSRKLSVGPRPPEALSIPEETFLNRIEKRFRGNVNRVRVFQKAIMADSMKRGVGLDPGVNLEAYLYGIPARAQDAVEFVKATMVETIASEMQKNGVKLDLLGDYTKAIHAPDRDNALWNEAIMEEAEAQAGRPMVDIADAIQTIGQAEADAIKKEMGNPSGMNPARVADIKDQVQKTGKLAAYEEIRKKTLDVQNIERKLMVQSGLTKASTVAQWEAKYGPDFVHLWNEDEEHKNKFLTSPAAYSVRGPEVKRARGRRTEAKAHPLISALQSLQRTILRSEKQLSLQHFADFVTKVNEPDVFGSVRKGDPDENGIGFKKNGEQYAIDIPDEILREQMQRLTTPQIDHLTSTLGAFTRWFSRVNTAYSPPFILKNPARDYQGAILTSLILHGLKDSKVASSVMTNQPAYIAATLEYMRNPGKQHTGKAATVALAKRHGAIPGFFNAISSMTDIRSELESKLKDHMSKADQVKLGLSEAKEYLNDTTKGKMERLAQAAGVTWDTTMRATGLKAAGDLLMNTNKMMEMATRANYFGALIDAGYSPQKAGDMARELTDFNRRGDYTTFANAVWSFFNASVQGTTRLGELLTSDDPDVRRRAITIMAGLVAAGMLWGTMAAAASGDGDDDGIPDSDQMPDWASSRNFVIPAMANLSPILIPMAQGFNIPFFAGILLSRTLRGNITKGAALKSMALATAQQINPIGTTYGVPTPLSPAMEVALNRDWAGRPVNPMRYPGEEWKPDSTMAMKRTPDYLKRAASALNKATGGDESTPGLIDVSPATMDHFQRYFEGGAGKFMQDTYDSLESLVKGEAPKRVPFISSFTSDEKAGYANRFYEQMRDIDSVEARIKNKEAVARANEIMDLYPGADVSKLNLTELRKAASALSPARQKWLLDEIRTLDLKLLAAKPVFDEAEKAMKALSKVPDGPEKTKAREAIFLQTNRAYQKALQQSAVANAR